MEPRKKDLNYDWVFKYIHWDGEDFEVIMEDEMVAANMKRIQHTVEYVADHMWCKLGKLKPTTTNALNVFWKREVYTMLIDKFQLKESSIDKEPTFEMSENILALVLKVLL